MTLRGLLLGAVFLASAPTDAAACHRFSVWKYPWPQRCEVQSSLHRKAGGVRPTPARAAAFPTTPAPVADAVLSRLSTETPSRPAEPPAQAVEALRVALDALMLQRAGRIIPPVQ